MGFIFDDVINRCHASLYFNVRGEPIICTPKDAYRCFMRTEMDWLVIGNHLFNKKEQPKWHEKENWQDTYELD